MVELAVMESGAAQRLKDNELSFRALVDAVQDYAIYRLDTLGRVASWNRGAERIKGYRAAEILGRDFSCFFSAEDIANGRPAHLLKEATEHGRFEDDGWCVRKDGTRFWANVVITALKDEQGALQGFAKITRDVTERKQAEDSLRQREHVLDSFFRSSSIGLAMLDRELRFQRINETLSTIHGLPPNEHLGKAVREVVPSLAAQAEPHMRRVLTTGEPLLSHELSGPVPGEENRVRYLSASYFPIRDEKGNIAQLGMAVVDITERRRAEESLRHLSGRLMELQDEERRRIARELHDSVGQALTAIKLNLELAVRELGSVSPGAQQALAESIDLTAQCATDTRTISYLLHPPLLDERGLASAIRWYVDGFARRGGLELSTDLPEGDTRLPQSYETTLFRVLQEALTNIHRHSGSATAAVRLAVDSATVTLEICDQGHGMPAASLRSTCNDSARLLGVGITGMRERVRQLGGRLEIQSSARGTKVTATLPVGGQ